MERIRYGVPIQAALNDSVLRISHFFVCGFLSRRAITCNLIPSGSTRRVESHAPLLLMDVDNFHNDSSGRNPWSCRPFADSHQARETKLHENKHRLSTILTQPLRSARVPATFPTDAHKYAAVIRSPEVHGRAAARSCFRCVGLQRDACVCGGAQGGSLVFCTPNRRKECDARVTKLLRATF